MYRIPTNTPPLATTLLAAALAVGVAAIACADQKDEQAVEQFLSRLGLTDVQIVHVEQRMERAAGGDRVRLGKQLADLYAQRLMAAADDKQAYDDVIQRVNKLIADIPEANTPALQVMILQADYNRAEKLILGWINDHSQPLAEAEGILSRIAPQLDKHWRQLASQAEALDEEIDMLKDEEAVERKQEELRRLQAVLGRASFFSGWSNFYYGVTRRNPSLAAEQFGNGRAAFRRLLGLLEDDKYEDIEADWLGLESIWRSRALIGLGVCEVGLDNLAAAKICFKLLEHINTPPAIRDQGPYWLLTGLLLTGRLDEAVRYASQHVETYSGGATQGKVSFCVALIRAEYADPDSSDPQTRQLARLGINGLARLRQLGVLRQVMEKYKIQLDGDSGFYIQWIRGQQQFEQAEASRDPSVYKQSAVTLEQALREEDARQDLAAAAQCRFVLAWCLFRLEQFEQAAKQFADAMPTLKESGETQKAIQAAWMAFAAFHTLARDEKRFVEPAIDSAKTLMQEFPDSQQARKVRYYLGKLQKAAGKPRDRIKTLRAVSRDDPNYENAQYEICVLWHEIWSESRDDAGQAAAAAKEVFAAVDYYLSLGGADNLRQLKAGLLAVDVALRSSPADRTKATEYLRELEPLAGAAPRSSASVAEYHFRSFQLARARNDKATQRSEAQWLMQNAKGTVYEESAILTLAQLAEQALGSAAASQAASLRQQAIDIYLRLVQLLGDSPQQLAASNNARVAQSKLARLQFDAGQFQQAAQRLDSLLKAQPKNPDYLRRAGLAKFHGKMYEQSLDHWRVLLAGLKKGSSDWYEAKYYQLAALLQTDSAAARKVYRQFKGLYPNVRDEKWQKKFEELDRRLAA